MDIIDLSLAIVGAFLYWVLTYASQRRKPQKLSTGKLQSDEQDLKCAQIPNYRSATPQASHAKTSNAPSNKSQQHCKSIAATTPDYWQPSAQPVLAPTFSSVDLDGEVQELLCQISPTS